MVKLPLYISESVILSDSDKQLLTAVEALPSEIEVDSIRSNDSIQELLNAFIGDESTRDIHLQLKAKEQLEQGNVVLAWKILLL